MKRPPAFIGEAQVQIGVPHVRLLTNRTYVLLYQSLAGFPNRYETLPG
jgi:hypothetical protein